VPANYTVVEAEKTADKPDRGYGPMQTIRLKLRNEQGNERDGISWYAKATTALPAAGSQVFGDVTKTDYGWQFKKARTGPVSGPSRDFKADPVKQAAIAMEASQKAAVEIVRIGVENKLWAPGDQPIAEMTAAVKATTEKLFEQIQQAMEKAA
jgi:hypothetical protein